jgi:hypothetical protein
MERAGTRSAPIACSTYYLLFPLSFFSRYSRNKRERVPLRSTRPAGVLSGLGSLEQSLWVESTREGIDRVRGHGAELLAGGSGDPKIFKLGS